MRKAGCCPAMSILRIGCLQSTRLMQMRQVVNDALASLDATFKALCVNLDNRSIAPERLSRPTGSGPHPVSATVDGGNAG